LGPKLAGCPDKAMPGDLTPREREILGLRANGKTNREIGTSLNISVRTVDAHLSLIVEKSLLS
jgi:DNA-binding CsgD family transcriptional regulator